MCHGYHHCKKQQCNTMHITLVYTLNRQHLPYEKRYCENGAGWVQSRWEQSAGRGQTVAYIPHMNAMPHTASTLGAGLQHSDGCESYISAGQSLAGIFAAAYPVRGSREVSRRAAGGSRAQHTHGSLVSCRQARVAGASPRGTCSTATCELVHPFIRTECHLAAMGLTYFGPLP